MPRRIRRSAATRLSRPLWSCCERAAHKDPISAGDNACRCCFGWNHPDNARQEYSHVTSQERDLPSLTIFSSESKTNKDMFQQNELTSEMIQSHSITLSTSKYFAE
jgi:hypothetical protein